MVGATAFHAGAWFRAVSLARPTADASARGIDSIAVPARLYHPSWRGPFLAPGPPSMRLRVESARESFVECP